MMRRKDPLEVASDGLDQDHRAIRGRPDRRQAKRRGLDPASRQGAPRTPKGAGTLGQLHTRRRLRVSGSRSERNVTPFNLHVLYMVSFTLGGQLTIDSQQERIVGAR
jgi:hypothetical protein